MADSRISFRKDDCENKKVITGAPLPMLREGGVLLMPILGNTGDLEQVSVATGIENPSFLALDPSNMKVEIAQWHWRTEYEG